MCLRRLTAPSEPSAELLGQRDDDPLGASDVAGPIAVVITGGVVDPLPSRPLDDPFDTIARPRTPFLRTTPRIQLETAARAFIRELVRRYELGSNELQT